SRPLECPCGDLVVRHARRGMNDLEIDAYVTRRTARPLHDQFDVLAYVSRVGRCAEGEASLRHLDAPVSREVQARVNVTDSYRTAEEKRVSSPGADEAARIGERIGVQ